MASPQAAGVVDTGHAPRKREYAVVIFVQYVAMPPAYYKNITENASGINQFVAALLRIDPRVPQNRNQIN